ncbi:YaeQ family protein [Marinobacteraceae bacterium S3BR75-40.1]
MALKATVCKAHLNIADMERQYYADHDITMAQHPSETDERMMVRLVAFALNASPYLQFTRGLSTDDEPELWAKNLTGEVDLWIELGQPDESRIKKACNKAEQVIVYTYGGRTVPIWWDKVASAVRQHRNLEIINLPAEATQALPEMAGRNMNLQVVIQDGQIGVSDGTHHLMIEPETLYPEH